MSVKETGDLTHISNIHSCAGGHVFGKKLTPKEMLCLYWTARGKTSKETALILHVSKETIETHKKRIMRKLKCSNMAQAVFESAFLLVSHKQQKTYPGNDPALA